MVSWRMRASRVGQWLLDPPEKNRVTESELCGGDGYLLSSLLDCRSFLGMSCGDWLC
jgi:hypothetical protein